MGSGNHEAKARIIEGYFSDLERRVRVLPELYDAGYPDEALLVCCCYIEGMGGNLYWPDEGIARNFVRVLEEYGGEEILWHIHPKQLCESFQAIRGLRVLGLKLAATFDAEDHRLRSREEVVRHVTGPLTSDEIARLRQEAWRGTLANLVYARIRCQLVHNLSAAPLLLSKTTLRGESVPTLDFHLLYGPLCRTLEGVTNLSIRSNAFFGHDPWPPRDD